ncbi:4-hydroxyphenylpyruvate dioxygenase [Stylophora pistillata]|uniref:4-hydroxyphenylpyruvate dioxygenase n=1 Tax=Stylophora pistillata TaxID=50429 RepID=A0A2B4SRH3_STYPI|nr:4-hydroxyphenylpyruvate dioxygenase [Stylophora pistillata]
MVSSREIVRHREAQREKHEANSDGRIHSPVYGSDKGVAIKRGAVSIHEPRDETDEDGTMTFATVQTYGDTTRTFVERKEFSGLFLPGCKSLIAKDCLLPKLPPGLLDFIDQVIGNQPEDAMVSIAECNIYTVIVLVYSESMRRIYSFTGFGLLMINRQERFIQSTVHCNSIVVTNWEETIKMPLNEPAPGKRKSPIQVGLPAADFHKTNAGQTNTILRSCTEAQSPGLWSWNFKSLFEGIELDQERRGNLY